MQEPLKLVDKLSSKHELSLAEYETLIDSYNKDFASELALRADSVRREIYGNEIFIRGLIEITNYCKNDCLYCGLRCSNRKAERYRLQKEDILACTDKGYELGFRTFVLQGGEDPFFTDEVLSSIVTQIKENHPDCAVTLSMGERSKESYICLRKAGADRYLLRHETADQSHYEYLHPQKMSFNKRMECLLDLRQAGFAVGAGFMVGSPKQTVKSLAKDLKFIESFKPEMCGIGPFIPHHATPFANARAGSAEFSCYLLSLVRLIHPSVLLPATTALATVNPQGRQMGILAGANVVMPNLSPLAVRKSYEIYDNKASMGEESAEYVSRLNESMEQIGYRIVVDRGDVRNRKVLQ